MNHLSNQVEAMRFSAQLWNTFSSFGVILHLKVEMVPTGDLISPFRNKPYPFREVRCKSLMSTWDKFSRKGYSNTFSEKSDSVNNLKVKHGSVCHKII